MSGANNTPDVSLLQKPQRFFTQNQNLFASREAFRKQLERRYSNGLAADGAVVETAVGLLIDPPRFTCWLLQPAHYRRARRPRCAA
ncbi:MAG TPA: hypothetical protein VN660_01080 [Steroidobacteraceae bacterium]|nr:hypothetical protein [Steroidobacteraceae bacterium]